MMQSTHSLSAPGRVWQGRPLVGRWVLRLLLTHWFLSWYSLKISGSTSSHSSHKRWGLRISMGVRSWSNTVSQQENYPWGLYSRSRAASRWTRDAVPGGRTCSLSLGAVYRIAGRRRAARRMGFGWTDDERVARRLKAWTSHSWNSMLKEGSASGNMVWERGFCFHKFINSVKRNFLYM